MASNGRRKRKQGAREDRRLRLDTIRPADTLNHHASFRHPQCYARALGHCSAKLSAEHYVSNVMLGQLATDTRGLFIRGVPWASSGRWVRPEKLAANVLCETHNRAMSPLDSFGGMLLDEYRRISAHLQRQSALSSVARFNGHNLERLMLKTLCGLLASGNALVSGQALPQEVPDHFLAVLFGYADFAGTAGLYVSGRIREEVQTAEGEITVGPVMLGTTLAGLQMTFPLFEGTLIVIPRPQSTTGLIHSESVHRPTTLRWTDGNVEHDVHLDWRTGPGLRITMMYERTSAAAR
jgi:hypothetical protein